MPPCLAACGEANRPEPLIAAEWRRPSHLLHGSAAVRGLVTIVGREARQLSHVANRQLGTDGMARVREARTCRAMVDGLPYDRRIDQCCRGQDTHVDEHRDRLAVIHFWP